MNIIRGWASKFDYERYDVTLLYSSPDPEEVKARLAEFLQLKVECMPDLLSRDRLYIPAIRKLADRMRSNHVDVVHTVFIQADILGAIAAHLAGVPAVVSSVMGYLVVPIGAAVVKTAIYKTGYAVARRWIDRVTAITKTTGKELQSDFGVPPEKIEVVYSGIPLKEYPRSVRGDATFVIGSAGQLIPQKGVMTIVEALPHVVEKIPNVRLVIVGEGPEQPRLEGRARDLGIRDRVEFLGFSETVPQLMATLDAFVFASFPTYDGLPRVILEAMIQRTPVIAARTEPIEEVVIQGRTGRLFTAGNPEELASELIRTAQERQTSTLLAERAHEMVLHFSVDNEVKQIQQIYQDILRSKGLTSGA